jgi:hypothetical protein
MVLSCTLSVVLVGFPWSSFSSEAKGNFNFDRGLTRSREVILEREILKDHLSYNIIARPRIAQKQCSPRRGRRSLRGQLLHPHLPLCRLSCSQRFQLFLHGHSQLRHVDHLKSDELHCRFRLKSNSMLSRR